MMLLVADSDRNVIQSHSDNSQKADMTSDKISEKGRRQWRDPLNFWMFNANCSNTVKGTAHSNTQYLLMNVTYAQTQKNRTRNKQSKFK